MVCDGLTACYLAIEKAASEKPIAAFVITGIAAWLIVPARKLVWAWMNPAPYQKAERDLDRIHPDLAELATSDLSKLLVFFTTKTIVFIVMTIFIILIAPVPIDWAIGLVMFVPMVRRVEEFKRRGELYFLKDPFEALNSILEASRRRVSEAEFLSLVRKNEVFLRKMYRSDVSRLTE